jgi:hypothetical protein
MRRLICCLGLAAAISFSLAGCSDDSSSGNNTTSAPQSNTPEPTNSNTLAGKTLQFTVTGSQNFSEPVEAVYTIDFHTDQTYTFHPSPQNHEGTSPETGTFSFDAETGSIHFARPDHQDIDGQFNFTSPNSGTAHLIGPEGETEDANFEVI